MLLRPAKETDLPYLMMLRNDPLTRANSRRQHVFDLAQTQEWVFGSWRRFWIAYREETPCGCVSFEQTEAGHEISVIIDPADRGKGYGKLLVEVAAFLVKGPIIAQIRRENSSSLSIFRAAGYRTCAEDEDYVFMRLER